MDFFFLKKWNYSTRWEVKNSKISNQNYPNLRVGKYSLKKIKFPTFYNRKEI